MLQRRRACIVEGPGGLVDDADGNSRLLTMATGAQGREMGAILAAGRSAAHVFPQ